MDCRICARRRGECPDEEPIGGYVYQDEYWYAYHAPSDRSVLGQLFLVSQRHFLDFAEMSSDEAATYGAVVKKLNRAMRQVLDAERVYALVTLEGVPHFHVWLIPRQAGSVDRNWDLINRVMNHERSCIETEVRDIVAKLRLAVG